ncbi:hypothetical protein RB213_007985, partial [Colletotrichum asianum]
MFESPATLWNCVTLATLSILTRQSHSTDKGKYYINSTQAADANSSLNFGDLEQFDFPFGKYRPCAADSCTAFGRCDFNFSQFLAIPINNSRIPELASMMEGNYCTTAQAGIDLDIAGPGIIIAYFIQFGLVFFFAVSFTLITKWMEIDGSQLCSHYGFSEAIRSSITDLQETQASYLVTIASAAIATFFGTKGTGLANISTILSWMTNDTILKGVVAAGSYPLLLIQLVLHAGKSRTWYTLLFVVVNAILVFVMHLPKDMDDKSLLPHFQQAAVDLKSCGNNAGPRTFCGLGHDAANTTGHLAKTHDYLFKINSRFPHAIYAISAILVVDWAAHTIYDGYVYLCTEMKPVSTRIRSIFASLQSASQAIQYALSRFSYLVPYWIESQVSIRDVLSALKTAYRVFWAFLELVTFGMCLLAIVEAKRFLVFLPKNSDGDTDITKWPFGQLVSVAVWFPIVLKFLYLLV